MIRWIINRRGKAKLVGTNVGYLVGESSDMDVLKDPSMLKRLNDINSFLEKETAHFICSRCDD